ncbi:MAG: hypothetical protein M3O20_05115 [Acidobacteriota bacterium]|nr:hypothetical protein [Acidobacteriota bacterium]
MKAYCGFRSFLLMWGLAAPALFGAAADRQQAQAQLLDHAEVLCDNCFLGPSYYYYCFAAGDKRLIGYQRTEVLNWQDKSKNYLTRVHKAWRVWDAPGETIPLSYDDKHIWVTRPDDKKPVKMQRMLLSDIFLNNKQCQDAGKP